MTAGPDLAKPRRTAGWGDQLERDDTTELEPTHIIRTPTADDLDDEVAEPEQGRMARWFGGLRFVHQSPGSLQDHLRWHREAAYALPEGPWRTVNIWWARIMVPPRVLAFFVIWAYLSRITRAGWWTLGTLLAAPILHGIPVIGWLPFIGWLDMTTWFTGTDPAVCSVDAVGGE